MPNLEEPTPDLNSAAAANGRDRRHTVLFKLFFTIFVIVVVVVVASLSIWLSWGGVSPSCSVEKFYIPALDQNLQTSINSTTLDFTIRFWNHNKDKGIDYDPINVTFSYGPSTKNRSIIANHILPSFYQRKRRMTTKGGGGVPVTRFDRDEAFRAISANGSVIIRVVLETRIQYSSLWDTKRFTLKLGANVPVNGNGTKINRKGIDLIKSGAGKIGIYGAKLGFFWLVFWSFLFWLDLLNFWGD